MKVNYLQQLLFLAILGVIFLTIYGVGQQILRQDANDPQIQLAEDTASAIAGGQSPDTLIPATTVDLNQSLAVFYIIYNKNGNVVASTARINGQIPSLPNGVLTDAKNSGQDKFTWQPQDNIRSAVVVESVNNGNGGYVLVGRSLREVERQETQIGLITLVGLLGSVILLLLVGFARKFENLS